MLDDEVEDVKIRLKEVKNDTREGKQKKKSGVPE